MQPDVEAKFKFINDRKALSGYRPAHKILENYFTTGLHQYYEETNGSVKLGTITFITPEAYPKSLWIGKVLEMYEGSAMIGTAEITKIFNQTLNKYNS